MRTEINLDKKVSRRIPDPRPGRYAFVEAVRPAIITFVVFLALAHALVWAAVKYLGWKVVPVTMGEASTPMVIFALLVGILIHSANERTKADRDANGIITAAFRFIPHHVMGVYKDSNKEMLHILAVLAWSVYHFFRRDEVTTYHLDGRKLEGFQPALRLLTSRVNALSWLTNEMRYYLLGECYKMLDVLGGIASRRRYPLLRSRKLNNVVFSGLGTFLMLMSAATGDGVYWLRVVSSFFFVYGVISIFEVIRHLEFGIGYDPGNVRPDWSLEAWFVEIDAACWNAKLKVEDTPWTIAYAHDIDPDEDGTSFTLSGEMLVSPPK